MNSTLWALAGPIKWRIAVSVALGLAITAAYVAQGALLAFALVAVLKSHDLAAAIGPVLGLAGVLALRGLLLWAAEIAAQNTAAATKETLRERLLAKLLELGPAYANAQQSGKLKETIVGGVEAVETYYTRYMPSVFVAVIGVVLVLGWLAYIDWRSALVLIPFIVMVPTTSRLWQKWRRPKSSGLFAVRADFGSYLFDSLQGLMTLKAFSATVRRRIELMKKAVALRLEAMRTLSVSLMRSGITGLLSMGGAATLLSWNAFRLADHQIEPVVLFMALFLAREAFRPLDRVEREFHAAYNGVSAAGPIMTLLMADVAVKEPSRPVAPTGKSDVAFDAVSFGYDRAEAPALADVSFTIAEGQRVALVGPSGAGKSTIVSLLLRFFDPQKGAIRIGGVALTDMSLADLRAQIAVVSQDTFLFHGTIADNLLIAKPVATDAELRSAAKAAYIDDFIMGLPDGYATSVGEKGARLSGGQRQRLAIARALLKDAPILVLDEATSNVDPASEQEIQKALDHLLTKRTTLVIAHRLSTIRNADRILVLQNGAVVERGTHEELVGQGGLYTKLTQAQGLSQGVAA